MDTALVSSGPKNRALAFLDSLPTPDCMIWTDGSARLGCSHGGSGALIRLTHTDEELPLTAPAGLFCSSTQAELVAILTALKRTLLLAPIPHIIHLCTDSRSSILTLERGISRQLSQVGLDIWSSLDALMDRGLSDFPNLGAWSCGH